MTFVSMPSRWSIASCLFPHEEDPTVPGPGPHPVLIAGVIPEKKLVLAAYGTGQTNMALAAGELEPYQIQINPGLTRLKYVTRFDFRKAVPIEWCSDWFKPIGHNVPIIMGMLDRAQIIQANRAMAECQRLLSSGTIVPWGAVKAVATPAQAAAAKAAQPIVITYRKRHNFPPAPKGDDSAE